MAAAPKIITVDLGTSTLKVAEFGVGRGGALKHIEVELWPKELAALQASAKALKDTRSKI